MARFRYFWQDQNSTLLVGKEPFKVGQRVPEERIPQDRLNHFVSTGQMRKQQVKEAPPTPVSAPAPVEKAPAPVPKKRGRPPKGKTR